jgi:hypothetical protein
MVKEQSSPVPTTFAVLERRRSQRKLWVSLPLYLVATLINDFQDMRGQRRIFPGPDGIGDLATFGGDAVIFTEDPPVPVRHLIQLLLGPMAVIPALLGLLFAKFAESCSEEDMIGG